MALTLIQKKIRKYIKEILFSIRSDGISVSYYEEEKATVEKYMKKFEKLFHEFYGKISSEQ